MTAKTYDMCMIGLGPVGTISAACIAKQGFNVVGVDIDPKRVAAFEENRAPFVEPGVDELIKEIQEAGKFRATTDFADSVLNSRIIMIAVGTPTPESGEPNLSYLDDVSKSIGEAIKGQNGIGTIVVVRSTVPPGTMRNRMAKIIEENSGLKVGEDFFVGSNPEFLREGKAIDDFFDTGRVVIGADQEHVAEAIEALYRDVNGERIRTTIENGEFAKYVDNTWHALKVSFGNEIGRVCRAFGGDLDQATKIFLADNHLNISTYYLKPGFAFGGSCLPKDVRGLNFFAKNLGVNLPVIQSIMASNDEQIRQGADAVIATGGKNVAILGAAFKEKVDDLRESASLAVATRLKEAGLNVYAHDYAYNAGDKLPLPKSEDSLEIKNLEELVAQSDTIVLLHKEEEYRKLAEAYAAQGKPVVDLTTVVQNKQSAA